MKLQNTAVFGLGSMGMGMAASCVGAGLPTWGFDSRPGRVEDFVRAGGNSAPMDEIMIDLDIVIIVVVTAVQMDGILFSESGIARKLKPGTVVLGCPTVPPEFARETEQRLQEFGIHYLDSPISGGSVKSASGALTVMASGSDAAFDTAQSALDAMSERVFRLGNCAGPASSMKVVNQLLAGVHIAATAEAMTFGIKQGIQASQILEVISQCAGSSWMFENRGPHIVDGDYTPHSSVEIFIKDLGIVGEVANESSSYTPLAMTALRSFVDAGESGFGGEDDSAVAKVYARKSDIRLPESSTLNQSG